MANCAYILHVASLRSRTCTEISSRVIPGDSWFTNESDDICGCNCLRTSDWPQENVCPDHLLTDRAAYISYLESQLEHVTSACMTVASFEERLEAATATTRSLTMKVCLTPT